MYLISQFQILKLQKKYKYCFIIFIFLLFNYFLNLNFYNQEFLINSPHFLFFSQSSQNGPIQAI